MTHRNSSFPFPFENPPSENNLSEALAGPGQTQRCEVIDCQELAKRFCLSESWIRERVRTRSADRIPDVRFGKYVRFRWRSPELEAWIERRIVANDNRKVGRALGKESK